MQTGIVMSPHFQAHRILAPCMVAVLLLAACNTGASEKTGETAPYTNRLADETSPYLLLHAHNPVDWYPWGTEALDRARDEDKPIFLSVGYSTCYWCHVMERLVFSDPDIAARMNEWYVNIKVDREERPDVDAIYMTATQMFTGRGGWPNSVFLTPELKPFYAGTYFPPEDAYGRPGFPRVLEALHNAWVDNRSAVERQAERLAEAVRTTQEADAGASSTATLSLDVVDDAVEHLRQRFDHTEGGFGGAPKFPSEIELEFLLDEYERTGDVQLRHMATHSLRAMAGGGIRDHLAGGFHRYATDARWRVPHFEKMLYNQAQLASAYVRAYALTSEDVFKRAAEDIFRFVDAVMTSPEGGFYSALDSETNAIEGEVYLWTERAIRDVLGKRADLFLLAYGLDPMPEGDGRVLYLRQRIDDLAASRGLTRDEILEQLAAAQQDLLRERRRRDQPLLDTKIIAAWNGQMIRAYAIAYEVLLDPEYRERATRAADFALDHTKDASGRLQRIFTDGPAKHGAFQDDYASLAHGLLALHRATGERRYLDAATELADGMITLFWDDALGGFYFTADAVDLLARTKNPHDGATPSGNSTAVHMLLDLSAATRDDRYRDVAHRTLQSFAASAGQFPGAFTHLIAGMATYLATQSETGATAALLETSEGYVDTSVSLSTETVAAGETFTVTTRLRIREGWHINANPASYEYLVPTAVDVTSDLPAETIAVAYPDAQEVQFAFSDDTLRVYQGEIPIRTTVKLGGDVDPGMVGRLTVTVRYQACDDSQCLQPAQTVQVIEVRISG